MEASLFSEAKWTKGQTKCRTRAHSAIRKCPPEQTPHKEDLQKALKQWGDTPHGILGGCKLKPQCDAGTRLLERPESRTQAMPRAGEDVEQQEPSFVTDGNAKRYSHSGRLVFSYKCKHTFIVGHRNHSRFHPKELKTYPNKNLYSGFRNLEASTMSFSR